MNNEKSVLNLLDCTLDNDIQVLGNLYMNGTFEKEDTQEIKRKFELMESINEMLFQAIKSRYGITVVFTEDDMYKDSKDMRTQVMASKKMYIFSGNNTHKFFSKRGNLVFRAIHDIFGHLVCGCPFSHEGEISAGLTQRYYYPKELHALLFSEIGLQTSAFYFNGKRFDGIEQRAVELDNAIVTHFYRYERDYSHNSVLSPLVDLYKS